MHAKASLALDLDVHVCVIAAGLVPFRISLKAYVVWYFSSINSQQLYFVSSLQRKLFQVLPEGF